MEEILQASCRDAQSKSFLTGWIDYEDERHFEAELKICRIQSSLIANQEVKGVKTYVLQLNKTEK